MPERIINLEDERVKIYISPPKFGIKPNAQGRFEFTKEERDLYNVVANTNPFLNGLEDIRAFEAHARNSFRNITETLEDFLENHETWDPVGAIGKGKYLIGKKINQTYTAYLNFISAEIKGSEAIMLVEKEHKYMNSITLFLPHVVNNNRIRCLMMDAYDLSEKIRKDKEEGLI